MRPADKPRFAVAMKLLEGQFGPCDPMRLEGLWVGLSPMRIEAVEFGVRRILETWTHGYKKDWPWPGDIRAAAKDFEPPVRALTAAAPTPLSPSRLSALMGTLMARLTGTITRQEFLDKVKAL